MDLISHVILCHLFSCHENLLFVALISPKTVERVGLMSTEEKNGVNDASSLPDFASGIAESAVTIPTSSSEQTKFDEMGFELEDQPKEKPPQVYDPAAPSRTRYEKWLARKKGLEEDIQTGEKQKSQFLSKYLNPKGERPSPEEIKAYERVMRKTDRKRQELKAMTSKMKQSFGLTSIPKTVDDAITILKGMAPSNAMFIKPKELRDVVALSAPGGVVDEVEVDKYVELFKERMMRAKVKALEDEAKKQAQGEADEGVGMGDQYTNKGKMKQKKKKGGKKQDNVNVKDVEGSNKSSVNHDHIAIEAEAKNDSEEDDVDDEPLPGDKLWYSTHVFSQLGQELVDVSKILEEELGTEGALNTLNTALMEEALALDKGM